MKRLLPFLLYSAIVNQDILDQITEKVKRDLRAEMPVVYEYEGSDYRPLKTTSLMSHCEYIEEFGLPENETPSWDEPKVKGCKK